MNIVLFQEASKRTFTSIDAKSPVVSDKLLNSIHCTLGMGSELLEEVTTALGTGDEVNLKEELGDILFYAVNYATEHGVILPNLKALDPKDVTKQYRTAYYQMAKTSLGKLQDLDKRELAYKKPSDELTRREALYNFVAAIEFIGQDKGLDMDAVRQMNVDKLLERYPLAEGFSEERAINRDTNAERKILEKEAA
jgi:NTP pyrophosphatase (non-canonical NTP hydrolase)